MRGIYLLLKRTPIYATAAILWLASDGMIFLLRERLEGLGYQVSYSAKFGDTGLVIAILIAATMLQCKGVRVPGWLQSGRSQLLILIWCVGLGVAIDIATLDVRSGQSADIYHDVVIAPAILFFAITLLPVFWLNARQKEWIVLGLAVVVWGSLVWYDIASDRMNQRQWLVRHDFAIKEEVLKR